MPDPFCSSQHLWTSLKSMGENRESQSTDMAMLELHRDMIFGNVKYFKSRQEPVDEQKKKLKKDNVIDDVISFIDSLSSILDLDLLQTYDLLFSFLLREYSGGKRNINKIVTEEVSKNSLISSVEQFYFQERIHIVKCLTKLVKIYLSTSGQQPFWDEKFSEKIFCPQFIVSVLRDFTEIYEKMNFTTILEKQGRNKCRRLVFHYFSLQEEIIKLLIWSFHIFDFSVNSIEQVLEHLTVLGSCQKFFIQKILTVTEIEQQTDRLECYKFLFVTNIFDLELLFYTYQNNFEQETSLSECKSLWLTSKNATSFEEALTSFAKNFGQQYSGGFYLSWSLNMQIRKCLNETLSDDNIDSNLTKCCVLAKQNNGFLACLNCLTSSCVSSDEELSELASAIIYLIIDGCFSLFEPFSLGNVEVVHDILTVSLKNENVADDFLSKNFSFGVSQYVRDDILYNFPYCLENVLKLATSICSASKESCSNFINVFQKFPCYCERFDTFDHNDFKLVGENLYESTKDRRPYCSDAFIIPSGSIGQLLETTGGDFEIRWRVLVNCWQILLTELSNDSSDRGDKTRLIFQLMDAVLTSDPTLATQFVHFLNQAVEILKTNSLQNAKDVHLLSSCLSCLTRASVLFPDEVLNMLVTAQFLPSLEAEGSNIGLIGKIINDIETEIGQYSFCINFLELVFNWLLNENLLNNVNVTASVGFVLHKIFPFYQNWLYADESDKDVIGCLCLKIFQKSIESLLVVQKFEPSARSLRRISKLTVDSLMFDEARHNLMKIASVGPDVLRSLLRMSDSEKGACRAFEMVAKSISLISQLVDVANVFGKQFFTLESKGLPPLFANFFDKRDNFISVLGKYIIFSAYEPLPRLALLCLEKIADTFPCSLLSAFGENVEGFCDVFLNRLESPFENWQLKLSCVNFFTVCIQKQAGLAEKLTCSGQSDTTAGSSSTDYCGLKLIFGILQQSSAQPELFVACIRLFSALWRCKWKESTKILKKLPDFWRIITSPLTASEEDFYLKICSEVFDLLALDVYYFGRQSASSDVVDEHERNSFKVVEKLLKSDRIELIFIKYKEFFESNCETEKKLSIFKNWSNFINVSLFRLQSLFDEEVTFDLIQRCSVLQFDLLNAHNDEFRTLVESVGYFYERFVKFASSSFVISHRWTAIAEIFGRIIEVLSEASYDANLASISISPLYASLVILSEDKRKFIEKREFVQSILNSLCLILNKLIFQFIQLNDAKSKYMVQKSMILTIGCIRAAVQRLEQSIWLTTFKKYCVLPNLVSVLSVRLNIPNDCNLFDSIVNLFSAITQYDEALGTLRMSGFNDFVCSKLPSFYSYSSPNDGNVFASLLTFYSFGLGNLQHKFVEDALVFICSWEETFAFVVHRCFELPSDQNLKSLKLICLFLRYFALYKDRWIVKAVRIYDFVTDLVSKTSMRLIAYMSKPTFIKELPQKKSSDDVEVASSQSHRSNVQQKFVEMLLICTQIMLEFSPKLEDIPSDFNFDLDAFKPLCNLDFSTNLNPEVESFLTFGGLLLSCILSVNCLKKIDGIKSTSPSVHRSPTTIGASLISTQIEKNSLSCLVESTVYLCISQGFVQVNQLWALDGQEALIKRELGTELDLILSKCGRSAGSPSTPRKSPAVFPSPAGATSSSFDQDFVKLAREFVRALFKS